MVTYDWVDLLFRLYTSICSLSYSFLEFLNYRFTIGDTTYPMYIIMFGVGFTSFITFRILKSLIS